jgi:hypothetical protein
MKKLLLLVLALSLSAAALAADAGTVVVYRVHDLLWHVGYLVQVDGAQLGTFDANTSLTITLPPGKHTIGIPGDHAVVDVAPGGVSYVRAKMCYGCRAGSNIREVSASEAAPDLAKSRPVAARNVEAVNLLASSPEPSPAK